MWFPCPCTRGSLQCLCTDRAPFGWLYCRSQRECSESRYARLRSRRSLSLLRSLLRALAAIARNYTWLERSCESIQTKVLSISSWVGTGGRVNGFIWRGDCIRRNTVYTAWPIKTYGCVLGSIYCSQRKTTSSLQ